MLENILLGGHTSYKLILKKASNKVVGELSPSYIDSIVVNAVDHNQLILKIPRYVTIIDGENEDAVQKIENKHYNLKEKWIIDVYINDGKNKVENKLSFYIASISIKQDSKDDIYKQITAYGMSKRTTKVSVFFPDGATRKLVNIEGDVDIGESYLNIILDKLKPLGWSLGYVDKSVLKENYNNSDYNKYRWLDAGEYKCYSLLRDTLQQAFGCVFIFDDYNKTISIYDEENFGENKGFILEEGKLMKSIELSSGEDDIVTVLHARGKDNISINSYNPMGTDYVEDYSYYMNNGAMSDELINALNDYYKIAEKYNEQWLKLRDQLTAKESEMTKKDSEIYSKDQEISRIKILMSASIGAGDNKASQNEVGTYKQQLETAQNELAQLLKEKGEIQSSIENINTKIAAVTLKTNKTTCTYDDTGKSVFSDALLEELSYFQEEDTFESENYTTAITLYNAVKKEIKKKSKPIITTNIDAIDFLDCIIPPKGFNYWMKIGDYVTTKSEINSEKYRLTSFTHKPGKSLTLTLSSKIVLEDKAKSTVKSITATVSGHNNLMRTYQDAWNDAILSTDFVTAMRTDCLDLTASKIKSKVTTNNFLIDETGQWIVDANDNDLQTYIGSGVFALTTDGWEHASLAITPEGVNARMLISEAILSNKFYITSEDGRVVIEKTGMKIFDANNTMRVFLGINDSGESVLELYSADGKKALLTQQGIQNNQMLNFSDNISPGYPIQEPFRIAPNMTEIREARLDVFLLPWRSFERVAQYDGEYTTTSGTTSSEGGYYANSTGAGGSTSTNNWDNTGGLGGNVNIYQYYTTTSASSNAVGFPTGDYTGSGDKLEHKHRINPGLFVHSHTIPSHSHTFSVPNHTHTISLTVSIPSHGHNLEHGIYEDASAVPTNCQLWVNHQLVLSGFGYNLINYDIKQYLTTGENLIEILSDTNGRVKCSLNICGFLTW